jgi:glycosyltransferase involved in cell wall biosynthesis
MSEAVNRNILFFQNSILPADGGVARVSDIISREFVRRGNKCYFVFYAKDNESYPQQLKLKADLKKPAKQLEDDVVQFIKDNNVNVFICQNTYSPAFITLFKRLRQLYPTYPFLCFLHASPDYWRLTYNAKADPSKHKYLLNIAKKTLKKIVFPFYNPYIKTTRELYNICDKFILLSNSFKKPFLEIYNIPETANKLLTIPNPLTYSDYISTQQLAEKERIVLIVSRLDESQKKISVALRIWEQVSKQHTSWKLLIAGSGPDEAFYKKYVAANGLQNVTFLGQQNDVLPYQLKSSIFMMTSIWEGLPMALLEAQQNGVIPIAFDNFSAIYDVINDGENGYIIRDNNMALFAEKLSNLMGEDTLRCKMALAAVVGSKRFHVKNIVDLWQETINV